MAQKVLIVRTDDIDGSELGEGGETVTFALDGTTYELDLSAKNADKLRKSLATYIEHGRKVGKSSAGRKSTSKSDYDAKAVRQWATENGIDVPARGRIPGELVEQYKAAN